MNPAIHIALIAASEAEQGIEARLQEAKAVNALSAIAYTPADDEQRKSLDEAIGRGLVMRRADGHYYLNQRAISERNEGIGYGLLLGLLAAGSVAVSIVALVLL